MSAVAEGEGHHPDFHLTNYRDVRVEVTTHAIGGLSLHDFVLAGFLWVSGRQLHSTPFVRSFVLSFVCSRIRDSFGHGVPGTQLRWYRSTRLCTHLFSGIATTRVRCVCVRPDV